LAAAVHIINVCITFSDSLIIARAPQTQVNVCQKEKLWHHKSHQFNTSSWHNVYVEVAHHLSHSQTQAYENGIFFLHQASSSNEETSQLETIKEDGH